MGVPIETIGVIGAGAWGTALAQVAARAGRRVTLWARTPEAADAIRQARENKTRLAGIAIDPGISVTAKAADLSDADAVLVATPAQALRAVMSAMAPYLRAGTPAVITAKGIERGSTKLMTDVLAEACPRVEPLVLSGPGFAADVAHGLPTAVTLAARTIDVARPIAHALSVPTFRPYLSDDLVGVQVGGAVKNVLAIAAGIVMGRGLGESARAALIARAFAELTRFGRALGARPETLAGLSGLGDLVLSASSSQSRNYRLGVALGEGQRLAELLDPARGISEGAFTAEAVVAIARTHGLDVPVSAAVYDILEGQATIDAAIDRLLQRPIKTED